MQQIQASFGAFAATLGDGSVVSWGTAGNAPAVLRWLQSPRKAACPLLPAAPLSCPPRLPASVPLALPSAAKSAAPDAGNWQRKQATLAVAALAGVCAPLGHTGIVKNRSRVSCARTTAGKNAFNMS